MGRWRTKTSEELDTLKAMTANAHDIEQAAHELIDQLPDNVSWDELAYRLAVRASIERGLAESEAGLGIPQEEVERRFGITR